ncbi:Predicted nucleic acid-binding protein, contains PIN domain [Bosea sp. CRIB-10]|uniref:PIN domain-containing protein n=1 Tax=Bosea sp. CRIB-10 TaxID=378404 RepID=UPI0008ECE6C6|nr:PIN domain-containing protein [Bosea sp. CRIB-10]SFC89677.1 Predicted nucleic acid-binding protein, contains PIN domain [Bosea sp. CRIB-10]
MRKPSETLVVDANIILSAVLGFRARPLLEQIGARRALVISSGAALEVRHVLSRIAPDTPILIEIASEILEAIEMVEEVRYNDGLGAAAQSLRRAVGSRNGSINDAHILALAWTYDADIWSHDRDFAGTGWPSWSSANLAAALADEAGAEAQPI